MSDVAWEDNLGDIADDEVIEDELRGKIRRTLCGMVYMTVEEDAQYAYNKIDEYVEELYKFIKEQS